jgi:hypothetical protein
MVENGRGWDAGGGVEVRESIFVDGGPADIVFVGSALSRHVEVSREEGPIGGGRRLAGVGEA